MTPTIPPNKAAIRLNRGLLWFTRHWLRVILIIVGLYASLPFVAPTLMRLGATGPANVLYTLYSPFCHQFAFRSVFLYGEQPFYPRGIAQTEYTSYEQAVASEPGVVQARSADDFGLDFLFSSRFFLGNETMGYKTALCARDVAIYVMLWVGCAIYAIPSVRRRLRPLPFWIYAIAGLGPIGLDGLSQYLSYPPFMLWEVRETSPFFRIATGGIFGLMNAWLVLPYLALSMYDTRRQIEHKFTGREHLLSS